MAAVSIKERLGWWIGALGLVASMGGDHLGWPVLAIAAGLLVACDGLEDEEGDAA